MEPDNEPMLRHLPFIGGAVDEAKQEYGGAPVNLSRLAWLIVILGFAIAIVAIAAHN